MTEGSNDNGGRKGGKSGLRAGPCIVCFIVGVAKGMKLKGMRGPDTIPAI